MARKWTRSTTPTSSHTPSPPGVTPKECVSSTTRTEPDASATSTTSASRATAPLMYTPSTTITPGSVTRSRL